MARFDGLARTCARARARADQWRRPSLRGRGPEPGAGCGRALQPRRWCDRRPLVRLAAVDHRAAGDPHVAIPTDRESEATWSRIQVPSFRAGVDAGADVVMTTAVYVPGLGAGSMPALFSPSVVARLRTQLRFEGVIMSDSLSMYGIESRWSLPKADVLALAAGNDMLLLGNGDPAYEAAAIEAVRAAALSGRLDRAALHRSAQRVNALRDRWGRQFKTCRAPAAA